MCTNNELLETVWEFGRTVHAHGSGDKGFKTGLLVFPLGWHANTRARSTGRPEIGEKRRTRHVCPGGWTSEPDWDAEASLADHAVDDRVRIGQRPAEPPFRLSSVVPALAAERLGQASGGERSDS